MKSQLVAAVGVTALLSACGTGVEVLHSGDVTVLVGDDDQGPQVGVGFSGYVVLAGDCLGIATKAYHQSRHGMKAGPGARYTAVWPHGTKVVSDDPLTIDVPQLGKVRVGDLIGGGVSDLASPPDGTPKSCPSEARSFDAH